MPDRAALLDHAARLSHILEGTGAGTWEWNVQTGETRFNERWAEIVGHTLEELGPTTIETWMAFAHPDDLAHSGALLEAHFRGDTDAYECEARMRHKEGHWVWVLDLGRVMTRTADGAPEWMYGTHLDLTMRKGQEEALARSEWLLNRVGELANVGGWVLELDTMKLRWTAQTRRIHGVPDEFQPTLEEAIHFYAPEARAAIEGAVLHAMEEGVGWDLELPLIRVDRRRIWVRAVGEVERVDGVPVRLLGAFQDITDAREQHDAYEQNALRLALANDNAGVGVWELDLVADEVVWDDQMFRLYGMRVGEERSPVDLWLERVHPGDREMIADLLEDAIGGVRRFETDFRVVWPSGVVRVVHAAGDVHRNGHGQAVRVVGVNWDVTEQKAMEAALVADRTRLQALSRQLAEQHELMRVTLESIGDAVITTDAMGRVRWMNPVAARLTGFEVEEAQGLEVGGVVHLVDELERTVLPRTPGRPHLAPEVDVNAVLVARDGTEYGVEETVSAIRAVDGSTLGWVVVLHDVTETRRIASEMTYRATHDALTGLVNRAEFELRLGRAVDRAHVDASTHALLFLDLDQFKVVNDTCGHAVGDQLLQEVAGILGESIRASDTLARLGGDEFAIILEHCPPERAETIASAICRRMDDYRFHVDGQGFRVGVSVGLVCFDTTFPDAASVLQAADVSCFAAKEAGRNRVHRWLDDDETLRARRGDTRWGTLIERALDQGRFVLFGQRVHPLGDGASSVEVLVRMLDDEGFLVLPNAFLPTAERFGLAPRLDAWVLDATLRVIAGLPDAYPGTLNVNLSGQSLGDPAFHRQALARLDAAGPSACSRLCVEVTETAAVTNLSAARAFLAEARSRGVRVALDDFGAGASSFGYLRELPVDVLKIDGQFIQGLLDDPLDDVAVRCFVDIARVLGLQTVAEFVDRPELLARVGELGVGAAQGYLLHVPERLERALALDGLRQTA
ncbi:MAG: EAL domain-containing protein [Alphaproteobacteria bacterium]|nr:EAL domain-containing protein [Alphaproteobacteria bacterium]